MDNYEHPLNSPDLDPINDVWALSIDISHPRQKSCKLYKPHRMVLIITDGMDGLIKSMPARMKAMIKIREI